MCLLASLCWQTQFSLIVGAENGTFLGAIAQHFVPGAPDPVLASTTQTAAFCAYTSLSPVGAEPEAVPPAFSQFYETAGFTASIESSIWSVTADPVPVMSAQWVNPSNATVQKPPCFFYSLGGSGLLISANSALSSFFQ